MKLTVIGGGMMGSAMLAAALDDGVVAASDVTVVEVVEARRAVLEQEFGVRSVASPPEADDADALLVAVKPQDFGKIKTQPVADALVISIMAGVPIATISSQFGASRVVRVMPNLPAAVRAGMCAWTATPEVTGEQRAFAQRFLAAAGSAIEVDDEAKLDMATALSGSGPGYVYLVIEALIEGGVRIGLPRAQATELATQTVLGAADYLRQSGASAADLRGQVTSPGGTTAAGLMALEQRAVRAAFIEAVEAAWRRARELGGQG
jgi:pyrroline-5-carboxylate reductase